LDLNQLKELKGTTEMSDATRKARDDFRFVLSQSNFVAPNYLEYQSMVKNGVTVGYALAVPFNVEEKQCVIPVNLVKKDDPKMYVAAVCYQGGKPVDLLMFNAVLFAKGKKPVKFDKKNNRYLLLIKDIKHDSMQKHAFGHVIGSL
jgi:hypothetical protein